MSPRLNAVVNDLPSTSTRVRFGSAAGFWARAGERVAKTRAAAMRPGRLTRRMCPPDAPADPGPAPLRDVLSRRRGGGKPGDPPLERRAIFPLQPPKDRGRVRRHGLRVVEGEPRVHLSARLVARRAAGGEHRAHRGAESVVGLLP